MGADHGCSHCGATCLAKNKRRRQISPRKFRGPLDLRKVAQLCFGKPNFNFPLNHGDCGRHRTLISNFGLNGLCGFKIGRVGHAMGDDGAFKGNYSAACLQGMCNIWGDGEGKHA